MGCILTTVHSNKRLARPPIYHFKRLLAEGYLNHAFPVRHKIKDCDMMRSFMTLGTLTWGTELDEGTKESEMMSFPEETTIKMVYGGCPLLGRHRVSNLSPRTPTHYGWGHGGFKGVTTQVFHHLNKIPIYIYINMYFTTAPGAKIKKEGNGRATGQTTQSNRHDDHPKA
jgi:hypothetical protein